MHTGEVRVNVPADLAQLLCSAVAPELADGPEGSTTTVRTSDDGVVIWAEAPTVSTLRAALNGAVRLLDAAQRTIA